MVVGIVRVVVVVVVRVVVMDVVVVRTVVEVDVEVMTDPEGTVSVASGSQMAQDVKKVKSTWFPTNGRVSGAH